VSHIKLRCQAAALILAACLLVGCSIFRIAPAPTPTTTPPLADRSTPTPTATPDPCTGWWCTVNGVVYADEVQSGKELAGVSLRLHHSSYCSPTRGEHRAVTGLDGTFEFGEVFFHDTDRIRIQIESAGYEPTTWDSTDFYCFFCNCFASPLEIVLHAAPGQ